MGPNRCKLSLVLHGQYMSGQQVHNQVVYNVYVVNSVVDCALSGVRIPVVIEYRKVGLPYPDGTYVDVTGDIVFRDSGAVVDATDVVDRGTYMPKRVPAPFVTTPRLTLDGTIVRAVTFGQASWRCGVFEIDIRVTVLGDTGGAAGASDPSAVFEVRCSFNRTRKVFKTLPLLATFMEVNVIGDLIDWVDDIPRINVVKFEWHAMPPPGSGSRRIEPHRRRTPSPSKTRKNSSSPLKDTPFPSPTLGTPSPFMTPWGGSPGFLTPSRTPSPWKDVRGLELDGAPDFLKSAFSPHASLDDLANLLSSISGSEPVKSAAAHVADCQGVAPDDDKGASAPPPELRMEDIIDMNLLDEDGGLPPYESIGNFTRALLDADGGSLWKTVDALSRMMNLPTVDASAGNIVGWDPSMVLAQPEPLLLGPIELTSGLGASVEHAVLLEKDPAVPDFPLPAPAQPTASEASGDIDAVLASDLNLANHRDEQTASGDDGDDGSLYEEMEDFLLAELGNTDGCADDNSTAGVSNGEPIASADFDDSLAA